MKTWVEEALIEQKQKQKAEKEEDVSSLTYIALAAVSYFTLSSQPIDKYRTND